MKRTNKFALVLATLSGGLLAGGAAQAQDMYKSGVGGLYSGLNYTFMNVDSNGGDADVGTLSAKVTGSSAKMQHGMTCRGITY